MRAVLDAKGLPKEIIEFIHNKCMSYGVESRLLERDWEQREQYILLREHTQYTDTYVLEWRAENSVDFGFGTVTPLELIDCAYQATKKPSVTLCSLKDDDL